MKLNPNKQISSQRTIAPEVLYDDNDIIIINKPSGWLSIPDRFRHDEVHLRGWLEEKFGHKIFVVHRLDRDTSGVMVFAKNAEAHKHLSLQFEHHEINKKYRAVLAGRLDKDEINVDIPLLPNPSKKGMMMPSARGKESLTIVKVIQRFRVATLVECTLKTGRQHQLRVHCSAIGYPLLIDPLYGIANEFKLSQLKRRYNIGKDEEERPIISRATLHAAVLGFNHPNDSGYIEFTAPEPKDFKALVSVLSKYSAMPEVQW